MKKLSILIPTVPERIEQCAKLIAKLNAQNVKGDAEILWFGDNRTRTIGAKRNALLTQARGQYVAFCDDDDDVSDNYIEKICSVTHKVDVITFEQQAIWNDEHGLVEFNINYPVDGVWINQGTTQRYPWHCCAWSREIAQRGVFTEKNWGEDVDWVMQVHGKAKQSAHIPSVLHYYRHKDENSLALDNLTKA
jgi:glycosyltransferase involved in cell wall biosynthesis